MSTEDGLRGWRDCVVTGGRGGQHTGNSRLNFYPSRRAGEPSAFLVPLREESDAAPCEPATNGLGGVATAVLTLGLVSTLLFAGAGVAWGTSHARGSSCASIAFAISGDLAPPGAERAVALATQEMTRRTGIEFVASPMSRAALRIQWLPSETFGSSPLQNAANVGFSSAKWRTEDNHRAFVSGAVFLDATRATSEVSPESAGPSSVLLHELAHIVGLEHSPDPASVMHSVVAPTATWTAADLTALEQAGSTAGCSRTRASA